MASTTTDAGEIVFPVASKKLYDSTPIYVSIGPADVATVWRKTGQEEYFAAGLYLGLVEEKGVVLGLRYKRLDEQQKQAVIQGVKTQNKKATVRFDLE
ncbi:MAG: hypothetical protein HYU39_10940 [Thaumarchaeota archaeon]|nr:hypothetical protein [Nitrososphaerota archaeon]